MTKRKRTTVRPLVMRKRRAQQFKAELKSAIRWHWLQDTNLTTILRKIAGRRNHA